jgi:signal transduction histidine kinase
VRLGPLVRETVESFATALADTGYRIAVEARADPVVMADPAALEQVLVNLLDNAVKYSGDTRSITVRVAASASHATIDVVDRGIGIEAGEQARIFERFYRGEGAALDRRGFGLGLAIARELVAGQQGSIDVTSTPGRGSTFSVRLPVLGAGTGAGWLRRPAVVRKARAYRPEQAL